MFFLNFQAVMQNPGAYEVIDPEDFGVSRQIQLAHRLTGWNAMQARAKELGLTIADEQVGAASLRC
jgi:homocitrate synthase